MSPTQRADASEGAANGRPRLAFRYVAELWARMAAFYGNRWTASYDDDPGGIAGDTWAAGLAGMTPQQIGQGLEAVMRSADGWPPSLQEFRARCLGIPTFAEVVPMLAPGYPDPSPFARVCWRYLDPYALRLANVGADRAMMRDAYELAARYLLDGGTIPVEPEKRIAHDATAERMLYDRLHASRMREFVANDEKAASEYPAPPTRDE